MAVKVMDVQFASKTFQNKNDGWVFLADDSYEKMLHNQGLKRNDEKKLSSLVSM